MIQNSLHRPVTERRGYFGRRFFGFTRGFGGEVNMVRSRSSVLRSTSSRVKSAYSASRLLGVRRFGLGLFMVGIIRG